MPAPKDYQIKVAIYEQIGFNRRRFVADRVESAPTVHMAIAQARFACARIYHINPRYVFAGPPEILFSPADAAISDELYN